MRQLHLRDLGTDLSAGDLAVMAVHSALIAVALTNIDVYAGMPNELRVAAVCLRERSYHARVRRDGSPGTGHVAARAR